jgi:hypothetical protein
LRFEISKLKRRGAWGTHLAAKEWKERKEKTAEMQKQERGEGNGNHPSPAAFVKALRRQER